MARQTYLTRNNVLHRLMVIQRICNLPPISIPNDEWDYVPSDSAPPVPGPKASDPTGFGTPVPSDVIDGREAEIGFLVRIAISEDMIGTRAEFEAGPDAVLDPEHLTRNEYNRIRQTFGSFGFTTPAYAGAFKYLWWIVIGNKADPILSL